MKHQHIRTFVAWALVFCLMLCAVPAGAAPGDAAIFGSDPANPQAGGVIAAAVVGDTLYAICNNRLQAYKAGDAEPAELAEMEKAEEWAPTLIAREGLLWLLDNATGTLAQWDGKAFGEGLQLDWEGLGDPKAPRRLYWPVWTGDALYGLLTPDPAGGLNSMYGMELVCFDTVSGVRKTLPSKNLYQITPYLPGKLLGLSVDVLDLLQNPAKGGGTLQIIDAATGEVEGDLGSLGSLEDGGIAYDVAAATAYAVSRGQITASVDGGPFEPVANFSVPGPLNALYAGVLPGGYYVLALPGGIQVSNTDPQYLAHAPKPLRIKGLNAETALLEEFTRANPDIPVSNETSLMTTAPEIIRELSSGEDQVDIYALYAYMALPALMEKGYLTDLSHIPGVKERVAELYPQIQDAVQQDGRILALPSTLQMVSWRVHDELLERFGLQMPSTMVEYYRLLGQWEEELAEENTDYQLTQTMLGREGCVGDALQAYALTYETQDAPLEMNTPLFRQTLEAIRELPFDPVDLDRIQQGDYSQLTMNTATQIIETTNTDMFNQYGARDDEGNPATRVVPPLPFEAGVPADAMAVMLVYVINPNSTNRESAEKFIAFMAERMSAANRIAMSPAYNEPQRAAGYETEMTALQTEIADLEGRLETAPEADRRGIEETLAAKRKVQAQRIEKDWQISAEAIAQYRAVAEHMNLLLHSSLTGTDSAATEELNKILYRYMKDESSMDEALTELDKKLRMMFLEN